MHEPTPSCVVLRVRNRRTNVVRATEPLAPSPDGIAIGRESIATFQCHLDPHVSATQGTLECTSKHGIWIYVDHSERGTRVNRERLVHHDAVIVRHGDCLECGDTEITLTIQRPGLAITKPTTTKTASISPNQQSLLAKQAVPNIITSRPTPRSGHPPEYINSPIPGSTWRKKRHSMTAMTMRMPMQIPAVSSSQAFVRKTPATSPLVPSAPSTPPRLETTPRQMHHHHAIQSPQSAYYHVKWKDEVDQRRAKRIQEEVENENEPTKETSKRDPPPPLEYSSSPVDATSFLNRAAPPQAATQPPPPPSSVPVATTTKMPSPPPHSSYRDPRLDMPARKAKPDTLRIQISKKMAGYAQAGGPRQKEPVVSPNQDAMTPPGAGAPVLPARTSPGACTNDQATRPTPLSRGITIPIPSTMPQSTAIASAASKLKKRLDFTPPASPVAHQDILRQKQSLLNILKNKYKEEQLLKQQQEEWMRSQYASPPSMSPINTKAGTEGKFPSRVSSPVAATADEEDIEMPVKAPALLRTVSLGYHQPSPRLTAAVLASRARKGSFDDRRGGSQSSSSHGNNSPAHAASSRHHHGNRHNTAAMMGQLARDDPHRASDELSVSSSASTEPSNHRRITRSLSFSSSKAASSGELSDFLGYEEDGDGFTSFTTHTFFGESQGEDGRPRGRSRRRVDELQTRDDTSLLGSTEFIKSSSPQKKQRGVDDDTLDLDLDGVIRSPSSAANLASIPSTRLRGAGPQFFKRRSQLGIDLTPQVT
ncbi:hypothetical protein Poli38472_001940 [Pythium oligandrum]|uniref:FHA domain-containing protein n=1 Tax=Pythium oligandrum TaxID=41045 RepID=A0A8K1CV27_PYTOL|nr:hypothetical protein Poli38472_001940 [Pythium oligandrum]|eukprot:TMW69784.1 hypothetical protein Poli38472_001940 [Pythium oligandrum]